MKLVGHKLLIALVAIAGLTFIGWLPSANQTKIYQVIIADALNLTSSGAIKTNTPVTYNKVVVGKLEDIKFNPNNPRELRLLMAINVNTPITQGTRASLDHLPQLALIDRGADVKPLTKQSGQEYPTISSIKTKSFKIQSQGSHEFVLQADSQKSKIKTDREALRAISAALNRQNALLENFLTEDNTESIKQLLYSLQEISGVLSSNKEKINNLIINADGFIGDIKPMMRNAQYTLQTFNSQTLPQIYTTVGNLNESVALVRELLVNLNNNPSMLIRGKHTPKLGPGEVVSYTSKQHCRHRGCRS